MLAHHRGKAPDIVFIHYRGKTYMAGYCKKNNPFRGLITVSDKGQVVIPSDLREELSIKRGDRLIVLKRKDGQGFNCFKEEVIAKTFNSLTKD